MMLCLGLSRRLGRRLRGNKGGVSYRDLRGVLGGLSVGWVDMVHQMGQLERATISRFRDVFW